MAKPMTVEEIKTMIRKTAAKYGVDSELALAVARAESEYNPAARSPVGAMGLFQLMPATARGLGVVDPFDPIQSAEGGIKYLAKMYKMLGRWDMALAAYNWGPGNAKKFPMYIQWPEETKNYVVKIYGWLKWELPFNYPKPV